MESGFRVIRAVGPDSGSSRCPNRCRLHTSQSAGLLCEVAHMRAGRAHQKSLRRRSRHRRLSGSVVAAVCAFVFGALSSASPQAVAASSSGSWYKADLHVHSVISADAFPDLGILTQAAKNAGYNAIFLTDHNLGSNFPISGLTANYMLLDEPTGTFFRRWTPATYGSLSSRTDAVVTSPVFSGIHSLLLSSTSSSGGQTFVWTKRGPNFRSETGPINLQFSIYRSSLTPHPACSCQPPSAVTQPSRIRAATPSVIRPAPASSRRTSRRF